MPTNSDSAAVSSIHRNALGLIVGINLITSGAAFLVDNYLSDDQRYPLSKVGTNAQRAMGTNAMGGHTWGQMSSQTYKDERGPRA